MPVAKSQMETPTWPGSAGVRQAAGRQRRRHRLLDGDHEQALERTVGGHRQAKTGCS